MKTSNLYLLILVFIFSSLSFLLPNHYVPWLTVYQDFAMFLALFFIVLIIQKSVFFVDKFFIIIGISIVPLFQFIFHKIFFLGDALTAFIYIFGFGISFLVGLNLARTNKIAILLNYLSIVFIFCSVLSVFLILKQWLLLTNGGIWIADIPPNGRPFANFAQPNNCATFLCIGLMSTLYFYEKEYINQLCGIFLSSFTLLGIALTQSRTAWIFTLFILIWWFWKTQYFQVRLHRLSVFYFVGIFIFFIVTIPYISNHLGIATISDIVSRATSSYLRIPMWHQMLLAIQAQPLLGYGWNQVSVAQLSVFLEYPTTEQIDYSHNILLDLLIWNGIPLGVTIISAFSWWLYRLSQLVLSIEPFIALSMVGAVLVHSMLEFPFAYAFFLIPTGFLLGLVQAQDNNIKIVQIPRNITYFISVLSGFLCVWTFFEYRVISKDAELVRFESLNIGNLHAEHDAPNVILLTQLREQIRFIRTEPKANMSQEQLDWMRHVAYRYSSLSNLYRYAQALALNNQPDLAKNYLLIIEKLYGKKYSFESLYHINKSLSFEWQNKSVSKP